MLKSMFGDRIRSIQIGLVISLSVIFGGTLTICSAADSLEKRFAAVDANSDKKLSLDEFLQLPHDKAVLKRDFKLFDLDRDQFLSPTEFDSIPMGRPANERGPLPDPFTKFVDDSMAKMDAAFSKWDQTPDRRVPTAEFVKRFRQSFPPQLISGGAKRIEFDAILESSTLSNQGDLNRQDARLFFEVQMGIRSLHGDLWRLQNGQVVDGALFYYLDRNNNAKIDRTEFSSLPTTKNVINAEWEMLDRDHDGNLTYDEFRNSQWDCVMDPIEEFLAMDTNLNGLLDSDELIVGTKSEKRDLAHHAFPGFDLDQDRSLNLTEFRLMPQSSFRFLLHSIILDGNGDEQVDFGEFASSDRRVPLLMFLFFFLQLDTNHDGRLGVGEFSFSSKAGRTLYRMNADGTGWTEIFKSPKYPLPNSPKISPDGQWLVCENEVGAKMEGTSNQQLLMMKTDGSEASEIGPGVSPSWSSDGKQIAFFTFSNFNSEGVCVMDAQTLEYSLLVEDGWNPSWSPSGRMIAFLKYANRAMTLHVINVATKEVSTILSDNESQYSEIHKNYCWSGDSKRIYFKGSRNGTNTAEIASVAVDSNGPDLKVHYDGKQKMTSHVSCSPDGTRLLVGMQNLTPPRSLVHEFDPRTNSVPVLLRGLEGDALRQSPFGATWSPDGKFLILVGDTQKQL